MVIDAPAEGPMMMCESGVACGAMMLGGWVVGILVVVVLGLGAAALVKYLKAK